MGNECESANTKLADSSRVVLSTELNTKVADSSRVVLSTELNKGNELVRSTHKPDLNIDKLFDSSYE